MSELTIRTQADADAKIPEWLRGEGPFHLRVEPMEGPVNLNAVWDKFCREEYDFIPSTWCGELNECPNCEAGENPTDCGYNCYFCGGTCLLQRGGISRVTVSGGDSPLHPDWVRSLRDQCAAAGVEFAFLSWGDWWPVERMCRKGLIYTAGDTYRLIGGQYFCNVGRSRSGRVLDGRTHDGKGGGE